MPKLTEHVYLVPFGVDLPGFEVIGKIVANERAHFLIDHVLFGEQLTLSFLVGLTLTLAEGLGVVEGIGWCYCEV